MHGSWQLFPGNGYAMCSIHPSKCSPPKWDQQPRHLHQWCPRRHRVQRWCWETHWLACWGLHGAHTSFIFRGPYGFTQTTAGHMLMKTSSAFLIMASHESHNFWQLAPFSYGCFSSSPTQSPPVRWSIKVSKEMLIDLLPYHPSLKWLTASFILHTLQSASSIQHDFFL